MTLIADGLMIAAALTAALYCHVLSRRLRRLRDMDGGVGAAIGALSDQVDALRGALAAARSQSAAATRSMAETTARAEAAAARLELLIAASRGRPAPDSAMQRAAATHRTAATQRSEEHEGFVAAARRSVRPARDAEPRSAPAAHEGARSRVEHPPRRESNETAVLRATLERLSSGDRPAAEGA